MVRRRFGEGSPFAVKFECDEFDFKGFDAIITLVAGAFRFSASFFCFREQPLVMAVQLLNPSLPSFFLTMQLLLEPCNILSLETLASTIGLEPWAVGRVIGETLAVSLRLIASFVVLRAEVNFSPWDRKSTVLMASIWSVLYHKKILNQHQISMVRLPLFQ